MSSPGSNVDTEGFPVDQDGAELKFGYFAGRDAPISIVGSVFQEIMGASHEGRDEPHHLESNPTMDGFGSNGEGIALNNVLNSSSGGIPKNVVVEEDFNSDKENVSLLNFSANPAIKATFSISKLERMELIEF